MASDGKGNWTLQVSDKLAPKSYDVVAVFPSGIETRINNVRTGQQLEIVESTLGQASATE